MSTKHHFSPAEREYHDAFTYLRLMHRILSEIAYPAESGQPGDYYDPDRNPHYWEARDAFDSLSKPAQQAARRSLSMRGEK